MNITRYTGDVYCFFHYKLKLQINILKSLKKWGITPYIRLILIE